MSAPTVISTASITFNSVTYKCKSLPAGKSTSCEAVDVTCLDDAKKQFSPGAIVTNDDLEFVIAGDAAPSINAKAALTITLGSSSISVGDCVVKSVSPATIGTSNGEREVTRTVTFTPCGASPASA